MTVKQKRPVNLDLTSLRYPPMAIASILHRISGVLLFLLVPFLLYWLHLSLSSEAAFTEVQSLLAKPSHKMLLWLIASAFIYHGFAGIRHLIMDIGFGEGLKAGRISAISIIVLSIISITSLGLWLW